MFSSFASYQAAAMRVYATEIAVKAAQNLTSAINGLDAQAQRINARSGGKLAAAIADKMTGFDVYSPMQIEIGWKYYQHTRQQAGPIAFGRCQEVNAIQKVVGRRANGTDVTEWRSGGVYVNPSTLDVSVSGRGLDPRDNWSTLLNDSWLQGGIHSLKTFQGLSNASRDNIYGPDPRWPITVSAREQIGLLLAGYSYTDSGIGRLWFVPRHNQHVARGFDWAEYKQTVTDVEATARANNGAHPMLDALLTVARYDNHARGADLATAGATRTADTVGFKDIDGPLVAFLMQRGSRYAHDLYKSVVGEALMVNERPLTDLAMALLRRNEVVQKVVASIRLARRLPAFVELCKLDGFRV